MNYDTIIEESAAAIKLGKIILFPTDTIWGLGCDATDQNAVKKVYSIKERSLDKPFTILVSGLEMLKNFVEEIHPRIETLLFYHERPLTLIYKRPKNLPNISLAKDNSIGIRLVKDQFCIDLIEKIGGPITSTSANISNNPSPKSFSHISSSIKQKVDYIVPYRQTDKAEKLPSILATFNEEGELIVLRS